MAQASREEVKKQQATDVEAHVITDSSNTACSEFLHGLTEVSTRRGGPVRRVTHFPPDSFGTPVEPAGASQDETTVISSTSAVGGQMSSCDAPPVSTSELEPIPSDANSPRTPSPDSSPPPSTAYYRQERPLRCLLCRFLCLSPRICPVCTRRM